MMSGVSFASGKKYYAIHGKLSKIEATFSKGE
jgi:hypothetical protein